MSDFDNTNSGTMFVNRDKYTDDTMREQVEGANPNWPDAKGSVNTNGQDFWLSGWRKTAASGKKFWSFSLKAKDAKPKAPPPKQPDSDAGLEGDDIPF
jgi:hypothetical protein